MPKSQLPTLLGNLHKLEQYARLPEARWVDSVPWPRQRAFLDLPVLEALYGGAAGGGKSDSLLRGALQYVHVPGYAALILRTDFQRLRLSGGLIPRSHEWLAPAVARGECKWNGGDHRWTFKGGGSIQFGYLSNPTDKFRYGSSEYQYIAFDELTEFAEEDYTFMFSRLRRTTDVAVPYRIRGASNPGGSGHEWVKARFISEEAERDLATGELAMTYSIKDRVFVPAKVRDNPAVDPVEYCKNLMHLGPVTRERLMNGDWTIMPTGRLRPEWLRYFDVQGRQVRLLASEETRDGEVVHTDRAVVTFDERECRRFVVVDAAGGVEEIRDDARGKKKSYTAVSVWDTHRVAGKRVLVLRHVQRGYGLNYVAMRDLVRSVILKWRPDDYVGNEKGMTTYVEDKAMGMALVADLAYLNVQTISPGGKDKVARAAAFENMMEDGRVFLPKGDVTWRPAFEAELMRWQGLDGETNDQVDVAAYAAIIVGGLGTNVSRAAVDPRSDVSKLARPADGHHTHSFGGGGFMTGWR